MERGARPICDGHDVEAENDREQVGNAGRRKEGRDIEDVDAIAFPRPFDLAVENMMCSSSLSC